MPISLTRTSPLGEGVLYYDGTQSQSLNRFKKAIFGYGTIAGATSITNQVNMYGLVATNVTGVGTSRHGLAAASYGGDRVIFGYGNNDISSQSITNLVSNIGVLSTDVTGVGTVRALLSAAGYGVDKAIFGYGASSGGNVSLTNLVSNTGVVSVDVTGVGSARTRLAASTYGS